jgi:hypothetical protein
MSDRLMSCFLPNPHTITRQRLRLCQCRNLSCKRVECAEVLGIHMHSKAAVSQMATNPSMEVSALAQREHLMQCHGMLHK